MDIRLRKKVGMNALQRSRSERSDFSIARILADDRDKDDPRSQDSLHRNGSVRQFQGQSVTGSSIETVPDVIDARNLNSKLCEERLIDQRSYKKDEEDGSRASLEIMQTRSIDAFDGARGHQLAVSYGETQRNELAWLQYTRYRPPKLPRRSLIGKNAKRRPGVHPRIPFSSFQLQVLEDRYKRNAYLSRRDALDISTSLRLPQSRVKIWFQNRRARDRRESNNAMAVT
ncbi:hypothetical protein KPH14_003091 [Odynerus spinipes]|uniref:Homeobox domain-containing protein n=1 Tax=Odynerus spinipes TaxID=1348599 RepID=A0AAD9VUK6_9HYME|nr:hypothetical protein KPH14_003091 [Odynerus spinipes]